MSLSSLISLLSYYWWPQSSPGNNGKKTRLSAKQQYGSKGLSKQTIKYPENQKRPDFAIINMPLNDETFPTPEICGDFIATGMETYPATPPPDIYTTRDFCPNIRPQTILSTSVDYFNDPIPHKSFSSQSCTSSQPPDGHASPYMTHDQLQLLERRLADLETHNAHVCDQLREMKAEVREIRRAFKISQDTLEKLVEKLHGNGAGNGKKAETEHCVKIDNYLTNFTPVERMAAEKTTIAEVPQVGLMENYHSRRNKQKKQAFCENIPAPQYPGPDSSYYPVPDSSYYPGLDSSYYPGPDSSYYTGPDSSYYPGPDSSYYTGPDSSYYPGPDSSYYPGPNSESVQVEGERFLENWPGQHGMDSDVGIGQDRDRGFANGNPLIFAPPVGELQSYPTRGYEEPSAQLKFPAVGNVGQYRETYDHGTWPSQSYPVNCQNALPSRENTTGSFQYLEPNRNSVQVQDAIPPTVWPDLSPLEKNNWSAMTLPNAGNLHPLQPANNASGSYGWP